MATVSETELEQKTSEYCNFIREHFAAIGKEFYSSKNMQLGFEDDVLILQYRGK